jgi:hypothetical protein
LDDNHPPALSVNYDCYTNLLNFEVEWVSSSSECTLACMNPGRKLRAGSGRKAPEIAGTWKQYSHGKIFGFFPMISDRFLLEST